MSTPRGTARPSVGPGWMCWYTAAGARVLVFPTSQGSVHEWEDFGMMAALDEHLSRGWLQLFCVGSVDAESWYARWRAPHDRVCWHDRYDRYIRDEVLPFTASMNGNPFLIATGASFGAYHAMSFATRYPDRVGRVVAMSGLYDITLMTDGYTDGLLYFHNPCAFLRHEHDPARMAALRAMDLIIVTGREDSLCWNSEQLSGILWERGIGNALRLWDGWAHDWPWWQQMIRHYIGGQD